MYDYFEITGIRSHIRKIEGFSLPIETIIKSTKAYEMINEYFENELSEKLLKELVWGLQESRDFHLYEVSDFEHTCTDEEFNELGEQIDSFQELYDFISLTMSLTYLVLLSAFEIYLVVRRGPSIYLTTLTLFYGYIYFLCTFFYKVAEI